MTRVEFLRSYVLSEINECDTVYGGLSLAYSEVLCCHCVMLFKVCCNCSINVDIIVLTIMLY